MIKQSLLTLGVLSGLSTTLLYAEDTANQLEYKRYYISPFVGGMNFDNKRDLDSAFYYGIGAGYHFNKHWSVEAGALWFDTEWNGHGHKKSSDCDDQDGQGGNDGEPGNGGVPGNDQPGVEICEFVPKQNCFLKPGQDCPLDNAGGPIDPNCVPKAPELVCVDGLEWQCKVEPGEENPGDGGQGGQDGEDGQGGNECKPDEAYDNQHDVDVDGVQYYGSLFYHFDPIADWYPFVTTGLRHMDLTYHHSPRNTEGETLADVGVGVQRFLNDRLSVRATARVLRSFDEEATDFMADIGLVYYFGDRKPPVVEEPKVELIDREVRFTLDVKFEFDKDVVRQDYYHDIELLADAMKRYPETVVNLEGHTDWVGTDAYNMDLAQRRADAIREVLINQYGIEATRVTTTSYGESQPIATNETDEGRAQNRRTVAVITVVEQVPASEASVDSNEDMNEESAN